ncbi:OsmC family protein [Acidithiobacillus sulfuriphilus]|uniref:OsmC family peroxiredoxin n=2 Tax=Acidithiobacillus sulfuriphilus TaxID=1867749 RepID=A0A3M8QRZ7_9PROT|nr:OsmC family protein [Acidithiobacillus sulfuriphilus]RNF57754.1 OsmC family peroxiredoxin [Acidithiobacillus sulfuriphilus]
MQQQTYHVRVERIDPLHVNASVRDFEIRLGAKRADPTAGFNPVETLLSSMGACLLTAIAFVAEASHIPLAGARIELEATRQDRPPILTQIHYMLYLKSDASPEQLDRLVDLAKRNSTVFQTVSLAVSVEGGWTAEP